jgi:DNA-binding transcriptional regulator YiaG
MKTRYRNSHCEAIHSAAAGLRKTGAISDEEMRYYDDGCLKAVRVDGERWKPVIEPASQEEIAMIDERIKDYDKDPSSFVPLENVK